MQQRWFAIVGVVGNAAAVVGWVLVMNGIRTSGAHWHRYGGFHVGNMWADGSTGASGTPTNAWHFVVQ